MNQVLSVKRINKLTKHTPLPNIRAVRVVSLCSFYLAPCARNTVALMLGSLRVHVRGHIFHGHVALMRAGTPGSLSK